MDLIVLKRRVLPKRPEIVEHLVEALVDPIQPLIGLLFHRGRSNRLHWPWKAVTF